MLSRRTEVVPSTARDSRVAQPLIYLQPVLNDTAVDAVGSHVVGLIDHPESLPFLQQQAEILGRVDKLLGPPLGNGGVNRYRATAEGYTAQQQSSTYPASHSKFLREHSGW